MSAPTNILTLANEHENLKRLATRLAKERDALAAALRAIDGGARPRGAVVGGKTYEYIVPRALIDAARAALKSAGIEVQP